MQDGSDPEHNGRAEPLRAMGAEPLRGVGDEPLRAMEDEPLREKDADPTWAWRLSGVLLSGAISWVAIGMIRSYQIFISPLLGPNCRFTPTCSAYAIGAIQKHGLLRGGWGAIKRVCRCHPWNPGGYDPP